MPVPLVKPSGAPLPSPAVLTAPPVDKKSGNGKIIGLVALVFLLGVGLTAVIGWLIWPRETAVHDVAVTSASGGTEAAVVGATAEDSASSEGDGAGDSIGDLVADDLATGEFADDELLDDEQDDDVAAFDDTDEPLEDVEEAPAPRRRRRARPRARSRATAASSRTSTPRESSGSTRSRTPSRNAQASRSAPARSTRPAATPTRPSQTTSGGAGPNRDAVERAIRSVAGAMRRCAPDYTGYRPVVRFTFVASGAATSVLVPNSFATPAERSCMARAGRRARVPPFSGRVVRVDYPLQF